MLPFSGELKTLILLPCNSGNSLQSNNPYAFPFSLAVPGFDFALSNRNNESNFYAQQMGSF